MAVHYTARIPARAFGFESDETIPGFLPIEQPPAAPLQYVRIDPAHVFNRTLFEDLRLWWTWNDPVQPLYISGPTGCGKTSTVMQFMARVNAPVISVTCTKRFVKDDLVGRWGAVKGGFCWFDGPATIAWKTGAVLVINEFSLAPPETWVGVNDIFEGQSITIEKTGIAVPRHPNARIIITDNCRCAAAGASNYQARSEQDASTSDRFWHIAADWPDESVETDIIRRRVLAVCANLYAPLAGELSRCTARLAAFTRQPQEGSDNDPNKAMPVISTRVAVRLGEILACLLASGKEFDAALEQAVRLAAASAYAPARSTALMQAARFHFITLEEAIKASGSTTRSR